VGAGGAGGRGDGLPLADPTWLDSWWGHRLAFPLIVVAVTVDLYGGTDTLTALVRVQLPASNLSDHFLPETP
jgi:hypothetical protein